MSDENKLSRRAFIKNVAIGAAAVAGGGVLGATPARAQGPTPWLPAKWDYEADVVVVGAGFAAQATAIEASKAGANVLMLEKAPEKYQGGNSRVCGQSFIAPTSKIWEAYYKYLKAATTDIGYPPPNGWIEFFVQESSKSLKWFTDMGATIQTSVEAGRPLGVWIPFYPQFPGADEIASEYGYYSLAGKYTGPGRIWYFLEDQIKAKSNIKKLFETPMVGLVKNPITKEILGVEAQSGDKTIYVKGKRATVVCAGGWEYNQDMVREFQGIPHIYSPGSPYNTGETIKACWEAGADLRNMHVKGAPAGLSAGILPGFNAAIDVSISVTKGALIMVGANNRRFRDEYRIAAQGISYKKVAGLETAFNGVGQVIENGVYVTDKWPMPMHIIFDETARKSGPMFGGSATMGWPRTIEGYKPSDDNSEELKRGWIIQAANIRELASKIGRDPDALEATVKEWNEFCAAGRDKQFDTGDPRVAPYGRKKEQLLPIVGGPLNAVQLYPRILNTQGGMVRNLKGEVLDIHGKPIPRLYSAGENGGFWTYMYQCQSNVGADCFGWGRAAGQNAAALKPWDAAT